MQREFYRRGGISRVAGDRLLERVITARVKYRKSKCIRRLLNRDQCTMSRRFSVFVQICTYLQRVIAVHEVNV